MAAPAEERNICSELHIFSPICHGVGLYRVTHKADRFAVDLLDLALIVQHNMRIYRRVFLRGMAFKADVSSFRVGATPQAISSSFVILLVTRQAFNLTIKKR
jgi:hypothetical protein